MADPTIFTVATQTGAPSTLPDMSKLGIDHVDTDTDIQYLKILDAANASKRGLTVNADGSINIVVASGALPAGAATEASIAAVLAKLSADPATQTTLAAILAKMLAAPSTEAKQDAANALLTAIAGYVDGIEGLQGTGNTTAASILAKLNASIAVSLASVPSHAVTNAGTFAVQTPKAATPAQSSVANAVASTVLLAANAARLGATIFNDDTASTGATLKAKLGAAASASSFTVAIAPQGYYEVPFGYTGAIAGIASAATGNARITELTA